MSEQTGKGIVKAEDFHSDPIGKITKPVILESGKLNYLEQIFPPDEWNMLCQNITASHIPEGYKAGVEFLKFSENDRDGDIYPTGGGYFDFSAQAYKAIAQASGVQWIFEDITRFDRHPETQRVIYISYKAICEVQKFDGTWIRGEGAYALDFVEKTIAAEKKTDPEKRAKALTKIEGQQNFALQIVQTSAKSRAIRDALGIKRKWRKEDFTKRFVIPKLMINLDPNDPQVKERILDSAFKSRALLYCKSSSAKAIVPTDEIPQIPDNLNDERTNEVPGLDASKQVEQSKMFDNEEEKK